MSITMQDKLATAWFGNEFSMRWQKSANSCSAVGELQKGGKNIAWDEQGWPSAAALPIFDGSAALPHYRKSCSTAIPAIETTAFVMQRAPRKTIAPGTVEKAIAKDPEEGEQQH
ncbi:MAG: hypothetical protein E5W91_02775 [Mesorhizobium sp.]|uniref:hypothetical protein n=1 Tax=Mesorhizobium sp. TaxID=1871066 RepID=UPI001214CBD8|nr:hypothetical protein [Mesorhizobium sp.]TIS57535.1 MAG: hypothetical protein E5W91_13265 [Mesorhizobium sp.]TIS59599.1 MAG: hypothetical protein E5W91_02775 [Mesorhizobium sp.]